MNHDSGRVSRTTAFPHPVSVLVVDDHPLLREGLQCLFRSCDEFEVIGEAADGKQGCEIAQQLQPDVVLMDIELPKMNGIEATRWINAHVPHVVVVGLSINTSAAMADEMTSAGAAAYLTKDSTPEHFYRVIRSALTHKICPYTTSA